MSGPDTSSTPHGWGGVCAWIFVFSFYYAAFKCNMFTQLGSSTPLGVDGGQPGASKYILDKYFFILCVVFREFGTPVSYTHLTLPTNREV